MLGIFPDKIKNSLATHLLRSIFGLYFIVAILVTLIQLKFEFDSVKTNVKLELNGIGKSFAPALSKALWDYDTRLVDQAMVGIHFNSNVVGVEVRDNNKKLIGKLGQTGRAK